jgi:hypothetical protein
MTNVSKKAKKKKIVFSKTTVNPLRKKFQFFSKIIFFHNNCKNTKIVSGYAYFTPKVF